MGMASPLRSAAELPPLPATGPHGYAVLYVGERAAWRAWLSAEHARCPGLWLVYPNQWTGLPRVSYDDAVEEALCFGWIDGIIRKLDVGRAYQLYTPRRPRSTWSGLNKQRIARLEAAGLLAEAGLREVRAAQADGRWDGLNEVEALVVPPDLAAALAAAPPAADRWAGFNASSRKGILGWLHQAKRPATRAARIATIARMAALGRRAQFDPDPATEG